MARWRPTVNALSNAQPRVCPVIFAGVNGPIVILFTLNILLGFHIWSCYWIIEGISFARYFYGVCEKCCKWCSFFSPLRCMFLIAKHINFWMIGVYFCARSMYVCYMVLSACRRYNSITLNVITQESGESGFCEQFEMYSVVHAHEFHAANYTRTVRKMTKQKKKVFAFVFLCVWLEGKTNVVACVNHTLTSLRFLECMIMTTILCCLSNEHKVLGTKLDQLEISQMRARTHTHIHTHTCTHTHECMHNNLAVL